MTDEKRIPMASTEMGMVDADLNDSVPFPPSQNTLGFINTGSTTLNFFLSVLTLPVQGLAILLFARGIQQLVLSIDEVYEATGRRSRSKFVGFPWVRVALGVMLLAAYHVGLLRLTVKSWKALRRGDGGAK